MLNKRYTMKILTVAFLALAFTGCASAELCTPATRDALLQKAAQIAEDQKKVDSYVAGAYINGQVTSAVDRETLIGHYQNRVNKQIRVLQAHAAEFNQKCVR